MGLLRADLGPLLPFPPSARGGGPGGLPNPVGRSRAIPAIFPSVPLQPTGCPAQASRCLPGAHRALPRHSGLPSLGRSELAHPLLPLGIASMPLLKAPPPGESLFLRLLCSSDFRAHSNGPLLPGALPDPLLLCLLLTPPGWPSAPGFSLAPFGSARRADSTRFPLPQGPARGLHTRCLGECWRGREGCQHRVCL